MNKIHFGRGQGPSMAMVIDENNHLWDSIKVLSFLWLSLVGIKGIIVLFWLKAKGIL